MNLPEASRECAGTFVHPSFLALDVHIFVEDEVSEFAICVDVNTKKQELDAQVRIFAIT